MKSDIDTQKADPALLLIDLQNDFVEGGALPVRGGLDVVDVANRLMPEFRHIIATQDWHPKDHQSFASEHLELAIGDQFSLDGLPQTVWPDHCVEHTDGAAFIDGLNRSKIDQVFRKGNDKRIDSYSGFFDNGYRHSTGLSEYLRQKGTEHLFVLGLATDYCVRATVMDAIAEGFGVTLVVDGCRGVDLQVGDVERSIEEMSQAGAAMAFSHQVLK